MLFDISPYRASVPEGVQVYASGSNRRPEIDGFARLGIPVGVSANHLNEDAIAALIELQRPVMIDSGAFSEVSFDENGPKVSALISESEWWRRLAIYLRVASSLGKNALLVAPDQVGSQQETLRRLARFGEELGAIAATGAVLLLPLQVGEMSHRKFYEAAQRTAAVPLVPAMPMRKAATTMAALVEFLQKTRPERIHLLGIGIENCRTAKMLRAIWHFSPATSISMDSNRLHAVIGSGRPLTRLEEELRSAETEGLYGAVDSPVLDLLGSVWDYTDLIAFPSQWCGPDRLRAIAESVGLSCHETACFIDGPDTFLQASHGEHYDMLWIEEPHMTFELDRSWAQHIQQTIRSAVRTAAIVSVLRDSRLADQARNAC